MNITLLIGIAILIIIIILALKIIKGAVKFIFSILGALFIIALIIGALAYLDGKQAQNLLEEGNKTIIYLEGEEILAGAVITEGGMMIEGEGTLPPTIKAISNEQLPTYSPDKETEELIIFVNNESFNNMSKITISEYDFNKQTFDDIMVSNEPKQTLINNILATKNVTNEQTSEEVNKNLEAYKDEELKTTLFLMAFSQQAETKGTTFLLQNLKEEHIIVKPEFITLKLINWLPDNMFNKALQQTFKLTQKEDAT